MSLFFCYRSGFRFSAASLPLLLTLGCFSWALLTPQGAAAQAADDTFESEGTATESARSDDNDVIEGTESNTEDEAETSKQEGKKEDQDAANSAHGGSGVWEDPTQQYLFIGARYRVQYVPQFLQNLFAEGGSPLWVQTPGIEFGMRKDRFETSIFAMLGVYSMDAVSFKGKTDPELAWELVDANYKVLFLGADFMWSTPEFTKGLSMIYGAGIGLGLVFGDMNRTQSYPNGSGGFSPCANAFDVRGNVLGVGQYCDDANDHYNGYVEPSWANGGSSPIIFPWLGGQLGLRYKAHRNFVARVELGVTITSMFFGIGADYGL
jgi:hypothetical protein